VSEPVRAAGCIVWRTGADGPEVLVVHRPRYDDWSWPKGKVDPGETDLACAVREVEEETGLSGRVGAELPSTSYVDHQGRPKVVRYWELEVTAGRFRPNDEVDGVRWEPVERAEELLSYDRDREVLAAFAHRER
jgi:8-oxo-dGTP pyrophosphatase MutT (NUDIX family)